MSDFAQSGSICTLQRLRKGPLPALEEALLRQTKTRPLALILPCAADDLEQPALRHICSELRSASWVGEIVVSLNGPEARPRAERVLAGMPQPVRYLWTDGPAARRPLARLLECEEEALPRGKGVNVWAALGLLSLEGRAALAVTQDADVASFQREGLARLCAPCLDARLPFVFAKMYYPRVTDRLYGRVSRLFFAPLLQAVLRVAGHGPLLDFLLAFRYPLAGESALALPLARELPCAPGWGLETGLLCEVFRQVEPSRVCQVDGGNDYDHRHRPAWEGGLNAMCGEIARTLLDQLAAEGFAVEASFRAALQAAFARASELALRRSEALAWMNGLPFDAKEEGEMVAEFAAHIGEDGPAVRALPAWSRLGPDRSSAARAFLEAASAE